ncbi:MAG: STM3941 family protein [Chitinophagaceae bacterium]
MSLNISIPINRKRFPTFLILGLLTTASLLYDLLQGNKPQFLMDDYLLFFLKFILLVFISFFTLISLASYCKVVFDRNAMIKLTDTALIDNSSIFSCGEILWEDVADVTMNKGINMQYLVVKLKNPEKYANNGNFIKRYFIQNRIKKIGSPIIIAETNVKCNIDVLKEIIIEQSKNY